ncbi:conserved hypothetical protein [Magnetospirillum molischianum DSM 120]|uniref:Uncharacterized protein n=2 Tax=Magnetospirillum molischianum TaxID=1083 RepID=H8FSW2_MAGML|nr:conserved hypothetical protein [Magnetospirillum molischianum DSM 120]
MAAMPKDGGGLKRPSTVRSADPPGRLEAVHFINEALKGPAAAIFRGLVPAFVTIGRDRFYDTVMDSTQLLSGCLQIFQSQRSRFSALLVDEQGRQVNDDRVRLRCGRSVEDIVAMIVRTHAKRHFRSALGGDPNDPASHAGQLYLAIRDYLLHDWQVPLVPHYAPLPVETVLRLGPGLLDLRDAEAVRTLTPSAPVPVAAVPVPVPEIVSPPPVPKPAPAPSLRMGVEGAGPGRPSSPQEEFWWDALTDRSVSQIIGTRSPNEMRELVAALAGVNDSVRSELFAGLSLTTFQAAICLATAYRVLGRNSFANLFGLPGRPVVIATIAKRLRERGAGSRSDLKTLARLTEGAVRV